MSNDHEALQLRDDAIKTAGRWLALTPREQRDRPVIPLLRQQFGLSAKEAVEAVREANLIRARAT